jgi:hypothetical protein
MINVDIDKIIIGISLALDTSSITKIIASLNPGINLGKHEPRGKLII